MTLDQHPAQSDIASAVGAVDILINNAATVAPLGPSAQIIPDALRNALTLNVVVPAALSAFFSPGMRECGWGRIVNLYRPGIVDTAMQAWIRRQDPTQIGEQLHARFVGYLVATVLFNRRDPLATISCGLVGCVCIVVMLGR